MKTERLRVFAYLSVIAVFVMAVAYLSLRYLFGVALPFLLAWGISLATRPLAAWLHRHVGIPIRALRVLFALLLTLGTLTLLGYLLGRASVELWHLLTGLLERDAVGRMLAALEEALVRIFGEGARLSEPTAQMSAAVSRVLGELVTRLGEGISSAMSAVPQIFLFVLILVIASIYFAQDLEKINGAVASLLPKPVRDFLLRFKEGFLLSALRYLRSYLVIMLITFATMTFGFVLLGVDYALVLAGLVALLDLLPILGVGTFLIPFGIVELILGSARRGIGLFVLYIVSAVLRQFLEPRIVGRSLGLHPVVTLILLYGGYTLFGFWGLLLIPLVSVALNVVLEARGAGETSA